MVAFHLTLENIKVYRLCKDLSFNNLIGRIPSALFSIDSLSHLFLGNNSLSGILPEQKALHLQNMNLVGNNFTFDSSNIRPRIFDLSFAIKCGGGDVLKVDKIAYEADDFDLVTGTTITELYRISRQSPGSLRYYGLSLENGLYNGTLWSKDFDITKKAGGDRRAITEKFNAMLSENYLEIQLFWAGKGTCCILTGGNYGPLISALSVIPDFTPTVGIARKKNQTWLIVGIAVALGILGLTLIFLIFLHEYKKRQ
ncbi:hypothetical protein Patl1_11699 [Pistacia atlantica]|uniref:Uncharacterized protein n=1 Tax=Pistacia atlantica TaxID=434234 RepID=A0ACC1A5Q2_9ROSI|nr:hypothetical protein Patl1_11699 [Pistacia atlantica]